MRIPFLPPSSLSARVSVALSLLIGTACVDAASRADISCDTDEDCGSFRCLEGVCQIEAAQDASGDALGPDVSAGDVGDAGMDSDTGLGPFDPDATTQPVCTDGDEDGAFVGEGCSPLDCDDSDPTRYPAAAEVCDSVDNDCDGSVDEETDLLNDSDNCGLCGQTCDTTTTEGICRAGVCQPAGCADGYVDCDSDSANGCERVETELNSCGGCAVLEGAPTDACGTCDTGSLTCQTDGSIRCVGDAGAGVANACGGCGPLDAFPGQACGFCDVGRWACESEDAVECLEPGSISEYETCGDICCGPGLDCAYDACVPDTACATDADCQDDTYCDADALRCIPYGDGPRGDYNEECRRQLTVSRFSPRLQCRWTGPPAGDAYPAWSHVLSTPMVADFDFDGDDGVIRPSIVFTSDDGVDGGSELPTGVIRIIDGETCTQLYSLDMQLTSHSSPPAIGDLDGDGTPEIVAFRAGGGVVAFRYNRGSAAWELDWTARYEGGEIFTLTGGGWGGPGIQDLNNDGVPEVLRGGVVISNTGIVLNDRLGGLAVGSSAAHHSVGFDVDLDGRIEIFTGDGAWEWDPVAVDWVAESFFTPGPNAVRGYIAIGDFGVFPTRVLDSATAPEAAVILGGTARVLSMEGELLFGPVALPGAGTGGPPTIGDFDGDGRAEFAAASRGAYSVLDFDCLPGGGTGTCSSGRTDGILWTRGSQDFSSSQTGSSIFDFEGDERAEAIYADECFTRVYDGETGDVIFSAYRSSCTWQESPLVADVDGDFNSELIVGSNTNCNVTCSGLDPGDLDPQFPGIRCETNDDCVSGSCDAGLCRCASDTECCLGDCADFGFVCAAPPIGTAGSGNTCRSRHTNGLSGIIVYSDALDRWVNSRPIWNQLGYHVTNVNDDGTIPSTSAARRHWLIPGLNSFRQNIQGELQFNAAPDLTVRQDDVPLTCDSDGRAVVRLQVCNRGTETVAAGSDVLFERVVDEVRSEACRTPLVRNLSIGECVVVACEVAGLPTSAPGEDLVVTVDPENANQECTESNNTGTVSSVYCGGV
jgi:hypothetical protein